MPQTMKDAIRSKKLEDAYAARPPYQRNDYIGWYLRAKRPETKQKRLAIMLSELRAGNTYMGMDWKPKV